MHKEHDWDQFPYKCSFCDKSFRREQYLTPHYRKHLRAAVKDHGEEDISTFNLPTMNSEDLVKNIRKILNQPASFQDEKNKRIKKRRVEFEECRNKAWAK